MAVSVRTATLDDLPALVEMGRRLHAESPRYRDSAYLPEKVEALGRSLIPAGGTHVAEKDGTIIGVMAGYVMEQWFSDYKVASDLVFYIAPEHRKTSRAALMLVRVFERWAFAQGAQEIIPGISSQIDIEGTTRFYVKMGYVVYGNTFIKRASL